jgi:hypothetical protein
MADIATMTPEQIAHLAAMETLRVQREIAMFNATQRLELVRVATATLTENDRQKPVGDRGISASDITAFADTLATYVNASTS